MATNNTETDNNRCEVCGDRLTVDAHGNLYCPNYINCPEIATKRLQALGKHSRLVIKGAQVKGTSGFLGGFIAS